MESSTSEPTEPTTEAFDLKQAFADVGYVAVGLGVLGVQKARSFADTVATRVTACDLGSVERPDFSDLGDRVRDQVREQATSLFDRVSDQAGASADFASGLAHDVRVRVEPFAQEILIRVEPLVDEATQRLSKLPADIAEITLPEPFNGVPAQVSQLIEPVIGLVEPVIERAKAFVGSAA